MEPKRRIIESLAQNVWQYVTGVIDGESQGVWYVLIRYSIVCMADVKKFNDMIAVRGCKVSGITRVNLHSCIIVTSNE